MDSPVVGVAAALKALETSLLDQSMALTDAVVGAQKSKDTASARWSQLKAQLEALQLANPGEQSAESKTLIRQIDDAKGVYDNAIATVNSYNKLYAVNSQQLTRVQSEIDAMRGALLA